MEKFTKYVLLLSGLGGCWALFFNPNGILDIVGDNWPTVGSWLPAIGAGSAVLIAVAFSIRVIWGLRELRANKTAEEEKEVLNSLYELQNLVGGLDMDGTVRARATAIIGKLIHDGVMLENPPKLEEGRAHEYFAHLTTTIEKFGVKFAKKNKEALIAQYRVESS